MRPVAAQLSELAVAIATTKCNHTAQHNIGTVTAIGCYFGDMLPPKFMEVPLNSGHTLKIVHLL